MRSMVEGLQIRHLDICGAFVGFRVTARNDGLFLEPIRQLRCHLPLLREDKGSGAFVVFWVIARNDGA